MTGSLLLPSIAEALAGDGEVLVLTAIGVIMGSYDSKLWMRDLIEGVAYLPS